MGQNCQPYKIPLVVSFIAYLALSPHNYSQAFYKNPGGFLSASLKFSYLESNTYYDKDGRSHHSPYFHFSEFVAQLDAELSPSKFYSFYLSLPVVIRSGSLYQTITFFNRDTGQFFMQAIPVSVAGSGIGDSTVGAKFYFDEYFKHLPFHLRYRLFVEMTLPTGDSEGELHNNFVAERIRMPTGTGQSDITGGTEFLIRYRWIEGALTASYTYRHPSHALKGWVAFAIPISIKPGNLTKFNPEVRIYPVDFLSDERKPSNLFLAFGSQLTLIRPYVFKVTVEDLASLYSTGEIGTLPYKTNPGKLYTLYFTLGYQQDEGFFWSASFYFPVSAENYPEDPAYTTPKDPYRVGSIRDVEGLFLANRFPEVPGFYSIVELGYAWK